jgi:hypothetical protein
MPRKAKTDELKLEVMRIQGNQRAIRAETIRRERVLAPMVRVVNRQPELQRRFARDGGLVNFMLREDASEERDNFSTEVFSQQANLYNNRFFGESIESITPLTELEEEFERVKEKITKIQTELEECCEELKRKLQQVLDLIESESKGIGEKVKESEEELYNNLKQLLDIIKNMLQEEFNAIKENFQVLEQILNDQFFPVLERIDTTSQQIFSFVENNLTQQVQNLQTLLIEKIQALNTLLQEFQVSVEESINAKFVVIEETLAGLGAAIEGVEASVLAVEATLDTFIGAVTGAFAEVNELIVGEHYTTRNRVIKSQKELSGEFTQGFHNVYSRIDRLEEKFKADLENLQKEIFQRFEKEKKEILEKIKEESKKFIEKTALEVSQLIVGESYYKWDSTSSYYPTVVFVFNEIVNAETPRRSQIKARLKKTSQELTSQDIEDLKKRVQNCKDWQYTYGLVRANYVSADKRWKSTVFIEKEEEATSIFEKIGEIIQEKINPKLISYTTLKEKRPRITTRITPLAEKGLNPSNYNSVFLLRLRKATLLVNNTERPYLLYP